MSLIPLTYHKHHHNLVHTHRRHIGFYFISISKIVQTFYLKRSWLSSSPNTTYTTIHISSSFQLTNIPIQNELKKLACVFFRQSVRLHLTSAVFATLLLLQFIVYLYIFTCFTVTFYNTYQWWSINHSRTWHLYTMRCAVPEFNAYHNFGQLHQVTTMTAILHYHHKCTADNNKLTGPKT